MAAKKMNFTENSKDYKAYLEMSGFCCLKIIMRTNGRLEKFLCKGITASLNAISQERKY